MSTEGVDYSWARPGGAALVAAGKSFACRYLAYGAPSGKFLTAAELADLHFHGVAIVANFESTANRALSGYTAGVSDASDAKTALEALGFPAAAPVYFAVDFNSSAGQQAAIDQYLKGAASVLGLPRIGVYGSFALMTRCRANRTASYFWQTYAWSLNHVASWAHIYQWQNGQSIAGAAVDFDRAMQGDYGQWSPMPSSGPAQPIGGEVQNFSVLPGPSGSLVVNGAGHYYLRLADGTRHGIAAGTAKSPAHPIKLTLPLSGGAPGADRSTGYLVGDDAAFLLASDVTFTPYLPADCTAAVGLATAPLSAKIAAAQAALK